MKTSSIIKIIANLILVIFLITALISLLTGNALNLKVFKGFKGFTFNLGGLSYLYDDENKYNIADEKIYARDINKINIDWIAGKVRIEEYNGDEIEFYEENSSRLKKDDKMRYKIDNGTLSIKYRKPFFGFGFLKSLNKELVIRIPISMEDGLSELTLENVSSSIQIDGLITKELIIDSISGQINIKNLLADNLDIETVSGSVNIKDSSVKNIDGETISGDLKVSIESNSIDEIDIESVSGSILLDLSACPRELDIDSISGSVNISIPENDGFIAEYSSISGKFRCDFPVDFNDNEAIYKRGNSHSKLYIETLSGNITINKK